MRLLLLFSLFPTLFFAQSKIYLGERPNPQDLIYQVSSSKVIRMNSSIWGTDVLFIKGNEVFDDSFRSNCLYTIEDNKVYKGRSTSTFDVLYELDNGKIYQVSNSSLRRCIYTFSNNQIYVGDSRSTFDCLFNYQVDKTIENNELLLFLAIAPY